MNEIANMNVQYVETSKLRPNKENIFDPIVGVEYDDFKTSIRLRGVVEPLMVVRQDGFYVVHCGHNRLRAAQELGILELPCQLVNSDVAEETATETEICRRHMTSEKRSEMLKLKADQQNLRQQKMLEEKLHPEFLRLHNEGVLPNLRHIMQLTLEEQGDLLKALAVEVEVEVIKTKEVPVPVAVVGETSGDSTEELKLALKENKELSGELNKIKERKNELETDLAAKVVEQNKIKAAAAELVKTYNKERAELEAALEAAKTNANEAVMAELKAELAEKQKSFVDMTHIVAERQEQIDELQGDILKLKDQVTSKEIAAKASTMARMDIQKQLEKERERFSSPALLQRRLDTVVAELDTLLDNVIHYPWDAATLAATEKTGAVIEGKIAKIIAKIRETVQGDTVVQLKMVK